MKTLATILSVLLLAPLLPACGSGSKAISAAANVGLAAIVGGIRRATGACFTWCDPHSMCNPRTGFCEPIPDCDRCKADQLCEVTAGIAQCVEAPPGMPTIQDERIDPTYGPVRMLPPPSPPPLDQPKPEFPPPGRP